MRTVVLAVGLGRHHGLGADVLRDVYYTSLLRYLGCTGFSHEEAHRFGAGDDIQTRTVMSMADAAAPVDTIRAVVRGIGTGAPVLSRARAVGRILGGGAKVVSAHASSQCEVSIKLASLVGVSAGVRASLEQICERWDGKGSPRGAPGDSLTMPIRLAHLADV